jgi:hypothetical protein
LYVSQSIHIPFIFNGTHQTKPKSQTNYFYFPAELVPRDFYFFLVLFSLHSRTRLAEVGFCAFSLRAGLARGQAVHVHWDAAGSGWGGHSNHSSRFFCRATWR